MEFKIGDRVTIRPEDSNGTMWFNGLSGIIFNIDTNVVYPYEVRIVESCKPENGYTYVFSYEELKLDIEYYRDSKIEQILMP